MVPACYRSISIVAAENLPLLASRIRSLMVVGDTSIFGLIDATDLWNTFCDSLSLCFHVHFCPFFFSQMWQTLWIMLRPVYLCDKLAGKIFVRCGFVFEYLRRTSVEISLPPSVIWMNFRSLGYLVDYFGRVNLRNGFCMLWHCSCGELTYTERLRFRFAFWPCTNAFVCTTNVVSLTRRCE